LACRKIFEKYDCQVVGKPGGGGEYDVQVSTFIGNTCQFVFKGVSFCVNKILFD
jgi:hypothetical protein